MRARLCGAPEPLVHGIDELHSVRADHGLHGCLVRHVSRDVAIDTLYCARHATLELLLERLLSVKREIIDSSYANVGEEPEALDVAG